MLVSQVNSRRAEPPQEILPHAATEKTACVGIACGGSNLRIRLTRVQADHLLRPLNLHVGEKMKRSTAGVLSLFLMFAGWAILFFFSLLAIGDPMPGTPQEEIERQRKFVYVVGYVGIFINSSSLWMSGYAYEEEKKLSMASFILNFIPVVFMLISFIK